MYAAELPHFTDVYTLMLMLLLMMTMLMLVRHRKDDPASCSPFTRRMIGGPDYVADKQVRVGMMRMSGMGVRMKMMMMMMMMRSLTSFLVRILLFFVRILLFFQSIWNFYLS